MKVEFVEGLRVSDAETVEVAKMVLVGKENKDIVGSLNRHGQPAVGLSRRRRRPVPGPQAARGRRSATSASWARSSTSTCDLLDRIAAELHPGDRLGRRGRGGPLLQRQRRRGRGRAWRAGARRLQARLPDRHAGLARRPRRPRVEDRARRRRPRARAARRRVSGGMRPKLAACLDAVEHGVGAAHIVDGREPHSLLLELFTIAGIGTKIFDGEPMTPRLQALERDYVMRTYARKPVEFVRGEGARLWDADGQRVPRLPGRDLGRADRPLPPGAVAAVTEQAQRLMHVGNLFYTEPQMRLAERLSEGVAGRQGLLRELAAPRPTSARSSSPAGTGAAARSSSPRAASTAAPMGALSATPQETKQAPFAPLVPGFKVVGAQRPRVAARRGRPRHRRRPARAGPGRVAASTRSTRSTSRVARARCATSTARC